MPPPFHLNPAELNLDTVIADKETIRKVNPQRFEMEQLDAICLLDSEKQIIIGYKDVHADEFWTRGHFPGEPLMPGVLMCEAAAQLASYYIISQNIITGAVVGFGGLEEVRFRGPVKPGDRLVLVGKAKRLRRLQTVFDVQGIVKENMVFHGNIMGVPLSLQEGS